MRFSIQKQALAESADVPLAHLSADSLGLRFAVDRPAVTGPARAASFDPGAQILTIPAQSPGPGPTAFAAPNPFADLNETPGPNDTIGSAQAIDRGILTVSANPNLYDASLPSVVIQGSISTPSDKDFFSITLQAGELLLLDVDGTSGLDSHLFLYGPNGSTEIGDDDDYVISDPGSQTAVNIFGHNTDSLIHFRAITAGTYYFKIESFQDQANPTSGSYQLNVSIGPQATAAEIAAEDVQALQSGASWNHNNLTFGFPTLASQYPSSFDEVNPASDFSPFTATQRNATVQLLQLVSNVASVTFTQNTATPGQADLRYAMSSDPEVTVAYAYYPTNGGPNSQGGSAWFNTSAFNSPTRGNYAWMGILHETGHALGLKHGHEFPIALSADHDSVEYSIMTYRSYPGGPLDGYSNETYGYAQTLMMYDVAALQAIYGANFTINSGNSVYTWNPSTGEMSINGIGQGAPGNGAGGSANRVFLTVWDGGGADTYDMSNYGGGVSIDLTPGGYSITSSVQLANLGDGHFARGNVFNALQFNGDARSLIENAIGGAGNDVIVGNAASNNLEGRAGNDLLNGAAGADIMSGGADNDIYIVDNAGDVISENAGEGLDTVFTSVSYTIGNTVERLGVNGFGTTYAIDLTGNALDNEMWGNDGANVIDGRGGADIMQGFGGDDIYIVDNVGDQVLDTSGLDTVFTSFSYTLGASLERLGVYGSSTTYSINLTGNAGANEMWGNDGANVIDGKAGADVMTGYGGNDIYLIDNAGDVINESGIGGYDTVFAGFSYVLSDDLERVAVNGGSATTFAIDLTGNVRDNEISGNDGANVLAGQGGSDILIGYGGADIFAFTSSIYVGSIDQVADFQVGLDKIGLDDGEFAGLAAGALAAGAFRIGSAAQDADDRIIYNSATGALYFDADGNGSGAAVQFASLHEGLALTASDFSVI